ncbi:hypothetical protein [Mesorhizobium sp. M0898]
MNGISRVAFDGAFTCAQKYVPPRFLMPPCGSVTKFVHFDSAAR